jgi:glycosyl transferase family 25
MPPVWIVSLQRSSERRLRIFGHLTSLGLPFEFVDAVDGRNLPARSLDDATGLPGRQLTAGEIGCSLSHLGICRRLLDSGLDEVIVLEDDVVLDPAFVEAMDQRRDTCHWDLIHLHVGDPRSAPVISLWNQQRLGARHRLVRLSTPMDGTFGYLLRRSGAEKLLRGGFPVRVPADLLTGGAVDIGLRICGIAPALVRHLSGESTMPEAYAARAAQARAPSNRADRIARLLAERATRFYRRLDPFSIL